MTLYKGTQKVCPIVTIEPTLTTKNITQNGTYNASSDNADGYSSVTVNVSGGGGTGINREVVNGVYKTPTTSFTWSLPSTATIIKDYGMQSAFRSCTGLTSIDLSSLTTVNGTSAMESAFYLCQNLVGQLDLSNLTTISGTNAMKLTFSNCTKLTSVDLSSLTTVGGASLERTFESCTNLTNVDLSSLTTANDTSVFARLFYGCTKLANINFNSLQTIGIDSSSANNGHFYMCFSNCHSLTSITFPNLEKIYCTGGTAASAGTFASNNNVQKMYFPKLDTITYGSGASSSNQSACKNIFKSCSALTELHFGSANQSAIQATAGYSTAWGRGAGYVTIYFDL